MPFYTSQTTIPTVDNAVENYASNTMHFVADDLTALGLVHTAIIAMYNTWRPQMNALARQTNWQIKSYLDTDPIPRAPVLTTTFSLGAAPSGAATPPEVSLCLSYQGARVSGVPQARKRGRVYLPFLNSTAVGSDGRPAAGTLTAAVACGQGLLTASDSAGTWSWVIFSAVAPGYSDVVDGWVDNEFDTQRRRGRKSTARTTFT